MWSLSFLVGMSAAAIGILAGICVAIINIIQYRARARKRYSDGWYRRGDNQTFIVVSLCAIIAIIGLTLALTFPWEAEYHRYEQYHGTVAGIDKRLVSSDGVMEEKYVVEFVNGDQAGCLDTRCASVRTGDYLSLNCIKVYEFNGSDGLDCRFDEWRKQ